jgi:hypothetical protein
MKKNSLVKKKILCVFLAEFACMSLLITGCKRSSQVIDPNMVFFEKHPFRQTPDVNERFRIALDEYRNKKMDPEPILLHVCLMNRGKQDRRENIYLTLSVYDEDMDLIRFLVREESRDPNGTVHILEEEYPALVHYPNLSIVSTYGIPVSIRNNNQRKDEKHWKDYVSMNFDNLKEQVIKHHERVALPPSSEEAIVYPSEMMEFWDKIQKQWQESLPSIWMSMPEPNKTNIWIQVYDKAGHKSNIVNLIDIIGFKNVKED